VERTPNIQGIHKLYLKTDTILRLFRHLSYSMSPKWPLLNVFFHRHLENIFISVLCPAFHIFLPWFHRNTNVSWSCNFRISTLCNFLYFISSTCKTPVSSLLKTSRSLYIYSERNTAVHSSKLMLQFFVPIYVVSGNVWLYLADVQI